MAKKIQWHRTPIDIKITELIGKEIFGVMAQVRNPEYLDEDHPPMWRILKRIETFTEKGEEWVQLYWEGKDERCTFTGCTIKSNTCTIQLTENEYKELFNGNTSTSDRKKVSRHLR